MKKTISQTKGQEFEERIRKYHEAEIALMKKFNLTKRTIINFPNRKARFLDKLAISYITASGGILDTQFFNLKQ